LSRPGVFSAELERQARGIASKLLEHFDYVGVMAIEFFVYRGGLLVNEIAPRVHNSGHWTINGAVTSQFENHLRAICGLPLGATARHCECVMLNWVGVLPERADLLDVPGLQWHDYGKQPRPGRKVGHATLTAADERGLEEAAELLVRRLGGDWRSCLATLGLLAPAVPRARA
jgi:5-(carboxyamino)imidazole ribonucleotide synthase